MIKCIEFPDKTFITRDEMFSELKRNEDKLIALKKAHIYKSAEKSQISFLNLDISKLSVSAKSNFDVKEGYIYPVISTTRYMDSHKDVHFDGCFNRTKNDQQGKVYYALDHDLKWASIVAWPKDVKMFVTPLDWALVGKNYAGQTEALVFEIAESKITKSDVLQAIKDKSSDFENSIRMSYEKITLGLNSKDKNMAENKAYFDNHINLIANKEQALEDGYFWGVEALKIQKEGSLVIAGGSNDATSIITLGADLITPKADPPAGSHKSIYSLLSK